MALKKPSLQPCLTTFRFISLVISIVSHITHTDIGNHNRPGDLSIEGKMQNSAEATTKQQGKAVPSVDNEAIAGIKSLNISSGDNSGEKDPPPIRNSGERISSSSSPTSVVNNKKTTISAPVTPRATYAASNPQSDTNSVKTYAAMARGPMVEAIAEQQQQQIVAAVPARPAASAAPSIPPMTEAAPAPSQPTGPVAWEDRKQTKVPPNKKDSRKLFIGGLPPDGKSNHIEVKCFA
mmetsp:Transcript_10902/g.22213  ORF Transcript_10902/g.22213 Transcript_10902/m.22213 type:complete len:236 (-) Transcript_10902:944-1651(-)